jgi:hypothetical protein
MTGKTKNILLTLGLFLTLVLCYSLAVSKTVALKRHYSSLKQEAILFKDTPKQVSLLKQKQRYYDSLLNRYQIKGSSIQNNLLKTINVLAKEHNLKVVHFLEPHEDESNGLSIKSYPFTVEGGYNNILKLVYYIEQNTKFGEIINLHFERKKNFKTNKHYLQAHILLESFG